MVDTPGGDDHGGSAGKLDGELELLQVDVAAEFVVEIAAGRDGA